MEKVKVEFGFFCPFVVHYVVFIFHIMKNIPVTSFMHTLKTKLVSLNFCSLPLVVFASFVFDFCRMQMYSALRWLHTPLKVGVESMSLLPE